MQRRFEVPKGARALAVAWALVGLGQLSAAQGVEPTSVDDQDSTQEVLQDLQRQIDDLEKKLESTPRTGGAASTIKLFGRIHLDAWTFPSTDDDINVFENEDPNEDPESQFEFRRARIGVSGKIEESMLYKIELEFGDTDNLAFKDLYFGFEDVPGAQTVLIGNQKRPYGLDHLNSSRYNVFTERPFVVEALNQDARRLGIAAYGKTEDLDWNWRYGAYLLQDWAKDGQVQGDEIQPELAGRLATTLNYSDEGRNYTHLAVSGAVAWPDEEEAGSRFRTRPEARSDSRWINTGMIPEADTYGLVGLEALGNFGRTQVTSELMGTHVDRGGGFDDTQFWGGYIYVAWFLTDDYMPWDRASGTLARIKPSTPMGKTGWGAWQLGLRYSYADFSDEDILGGEGSSVTLGLNWYISSHSSIQFNYIKGDIDERAVDSGGTTYTGGDYDILGVRFRVDF